MRVYCPHSWEGKKTGQVEVAWASQLSSLRHQRRKWVSLFSSLVERFSVDVVVEFAFVSLATPFPSCALPLLLVPRFYVALRHGLPPSPVLLSRLQSQQLQLLEQA